MMGTRPASVPGRTFITTRSTNIWIFLGRGHSTCDFAKALAPKFYRERHGAGRAGAGGNAGGGRGRSSQTICASAGAGEHGGGAGCAARRNQPRAWVRVCVGLGRRTGGRTGRKRPRGRRPAAPPGRIWRDTAQAPAPRLWRASACSAAPCRSSVRVFLFRSAAKPRLSATREPAA